MQQMCEDCSRILIRLFSKGIEMEEKTLGGIWGPCCVCGTELKLNDGHRNYGDSHLLSAFKRKIIEIKERWQLMRDLE